MLEAVPLGSPIGVCRVVFTPQGGYSQSSICGQRREGWGGHLQKGSIQQQGQLSPEVGVQRVAMTEPEEGEEWVDVLQLPRLGCEHTGDSWGAQRQDELPTELRQEQRMVTHDIQHHQLVWCWMDVHFPPCPF